MYWSVHFVLLANCTTDLRYSCIVRIHICTFRKLNSLSSGNVFVREIKSCLFVDGKVVGKFVEGRG